MWKKPMTALILSSHRFLCTPLSFWYFLGSWNLVGFRGGSCSVGSSWLLWQSCSKMWLLCECGLFSWVKSIRATVMPVLKPFFVHQNWHIGCVNRLSRMCDSANSSNLTGFVDCRFVKVASVGRWQRLRPHWEWLESSSVREPWNVTSSQVSRITKVPTRRNSTQVKRAKSNKTPSKISRIS